MITLNKEQVYKDNTWIDDVGSFTSLLEKLFCNRGRGVTIKETNGTILYKNTLGKMVVLKRRELYDFLVGTDVNRLVPDSNHRMFTPTRGHNNLLALKQLMSVKLDKNYNETDFYIYEMCINYNINHKLISAIEELNGIPEYVLELYVLASTRNRVFGKVYEAYKQKPSNNIRSGAFLRVLSEFGVKFKESSLGKISFINNNNVLYSGCLLANTGSALTLSTKSGSDPLSDVVRPADRLSIPYYIRLLENCIRHSTSINNMLKVLRTASQLGDNIYKIRIKPNSKASIAQLREVKDLSKLIIPLLEEAFTTTGNVAAINQVLEHIDNLGL